MGLIIWLQGKSGTQSSCVKFQVFLKYIDLVLFYDQLKTSIFTFWHPFLGGFGLSWPILKIFETEVVLDWIEGKEHSTKDQ